MVNVAQKKKYMIKKIFKKRKFHYEEFYQIIEIKYM